jgi:hypothetical protein
VSLATPNNKILPEILFALQFLLKIHLFIRLCLLQNSIKTALVVLVITTLMSGHAFDLSRLQLMLRNMGGGISSRLLSGITSCKSMAMQQTI